MQQCRACVGIFSVIIILGAGLPRQAVAEGWSYRLAGEGGWTRFAFTQLPARSSPLLRLDVRLRHRHASQKTLWFVEGHFRPEIFLTEDIPTFTRFSLQGGLLRRYRTFQWRIGFAGERQDFSFFEDRLDVHLWQAGGEFIWQYQPAGALGLQTDFFFRQLNNRQETRLNALVMNPTWQRAFSASTRLTVGLHWEQFRFRQLLRSVPHENSGWRFGPEVAVSYQKRVAVSGNYRFLWHHSDITRSPSYEHWVRLLLGKILSQSWSAFFLVDYFFRNYNFPQPPPPGLVYAPLNTENRVYLKLERELSGHADFFVRMGYFSEGIIDRHETLSGWRATVGVELQN